MTRGRRTTARLAPPALALALLAFAPPATADAALPCLLAETNRHSLFDLNLDGDDARERVDVFNWDQAGPAPVTGMMVCDRSRSGRLVRANVSRIWGPGPGAPTSGLERAWAGDLDAGDGRVEVAARNLVSASAGEELVILRQRAARSLRFRRLQVIAADTVKMTRPKRGAAYVTAFVKANHSPDGREHTERWTYRRTLRRWVCTTDCDGRWEYTSTACAGEVPGQLGTTAVDIRVRNMTCAGAKKVLATYLAKPADRVAGFTITSAGPGPVKGTRGTQAFFFAVRGTG